MSAVVDRQLSPTMRMMKRTAAILDEAAREGLEQVVKSDPTDPTPGTVKVLLSRFHGPVLRSHPRKKA